MKKILAFVLAAVMVLGCSAVVAANSSINAWSSVNASEKVYVYSSAKPAEKSATLSTSAANAVQGNWAYDAATDVWTCKTADGKQMAAGWYLIATPDGKAQWYFFDPSGKMLTGWNWIKGSDGITRCYLLNPVSNGYRGACYMNGKTSDGWFVNASGAWVVNNEEQTK